jgi:serine protease Do
VDKNLAESFGLDRPRGALISQLQEGGPAEKGGLQPGDVIVRFDGSNIRTSADLPHVVGLTRPGTRVSVEVMRDGKSKTLKMKVGGLDADEEPSILADSEAEGTGGRLGMVVEEINEQMQLRWGISGGVVVSEVEPQGPADSAGLVRGDVVTLIGSTPITSVTAYTKAVEQLAAGKSLSMRIIRRGAPLFIGLKLD